MAKRSQLLPSVELRSVRYFSADFKRQKVAEIEKRQATVTDICKTYSVSATSVYRWIYKYSLMKKKGIKMVVEAESNTARINALTDRIRELEQLLGQKQFELEFINRQMKLASDELGVDIKKKHSGPPSLAIGKKDLR
ncbi:MAG: transposase [Chryseobacterium sp.]|nr:MAG: transposase [Chryseobacterium sp.]